VFQDRLQPIVRDLSEFSPTPNQESSDLFRPFLNGLWESSPKTVFARRIFALVVMNTSQASERESVAREPLQSLLNEHDVARITGLSVASVRRWRLFQQGPKFLKIGAAVRYKPADLAAWLESRPTGGGTQVKA
jgi:predicted DNA-binding transcriptional regulator AlpA